VKVPEPSMMGILAYIKAGGGYRDKKMLLVAPKVTIIDEPNVVPQFIEAAEQMGIDCHRVYGYTTRPVMNDYTKQVLADVSKGKYDMMAFSSGGELFAVAQMCNGSKLNCKIACFGPYTASNAREAGIKVDMVSNKYRSFDDYALSIARFFD
jgi:uroporphyrinogen-III synthase